MSSTGAGERVRLLPRHRGQDRRPRCDRRGVGTVPGRGAGPGRPARQVDRERPPRVPGKSRSAQHQHEHESADRVRGSRDPGRGGARHGARLGQDEDGDGLGLRASRAGGERVSGRRLRDAVGGAARDTRPHHGLRAARRRHARCDRERPRLRARVADVHRRCSRARLSSRAADGRQRHLHLGRAAPRDEADQALRPRPFGRAHRLHPRRHRGDADGARSSACSTRSTHSANGCSNDRRA